ncbi:MAG: branched-chain amino acid transport system permease protein, partial [Methylobacteriaceae bacterium]|nr:branched-chain amino acid transport system permease protein [Methylobacteriaceae bacterium]
VNGIVLGLLYGLIAVGLALIFGVIEIVNFAHGEMVMFGAFAMAFALPFFALSYWPAATLAIVVTGALGLVLYELLLVRIERTEFERSILVTLGISMILLYGMQYLFTATPRLVDTNYGFDGFQLGDIRVTWIRCLAGLAALAAFIGLGVILKFTQFGRAMRAIAQNREAALMIGIKPQQVARNGVIVAAGLCGLAGAALAPIQSVQPAMGQALIFKAFALTVIGGLGHMGGALIVAILLGLIESWSAAFTDAVWQEASVFLIMIAIVLVRPAGLFGGKQVRLG